MPVVRYFFVAGGALLALLFICNALMPAPSTYEPTTVAAAVADQPSLRIRSDHKWPARIDFDTSQPNIAPSSDPVAAVATVEPAVAPASVVSDYPAKARVRESFAQFRPADDHVAKPDSKLQPKRSSVKAKTAPPVRMVAQQSPFGLFGNTW